VGRTPAHSNHRRPERWKFKRRRKKKPGGSSSTNNRRAVAAASSWTDEEQEEEEKTDDMPPASTPLDWTGPLVKSVAGRLVKQERRSLDSAGSSEHSSSEDGTKRETPGLNHTGSVNYAL
jgi:hypothetical protein